MIGSYPGETQYESAGYGPYDVQTTPQPTEYAGLDEDFEYLPPGAGNHNWKWVAGAAAIVLAIAIIATAVILGSGDGKGAATASTTAPTSLTPVSSTPAPEETLSTEPPAPPVSTEPPTHAPSATIATQAAPAPTQQPTQEAAPEPPPSNPMLPPSNETPITPGSFVYYVTGDQRPGDLVTISYTDGYGRAHTVLGASLPWTMIVNPAPGIRGGSVSASSFASQINCSISDNNQQMLAVQNNNGTTARCSG